MFLIEYMYLLKIGKGVKFPRMGRINKSFCSMYLVRFVTSVITKC